MQLASIVIILFSAVVLAIRLDNVEITLLSNDDFVLQTREGKFFNTKFSHSIRLEKTVLDASVEGEFENESTFFITKVIQKRQAPRPTTTLQTGLQKRMILVFVDTTDNVLTSPNVNVTLLQERLVRVSDYYFQNSYGRLRFPTIIIDPSIYRLPNTFTNYASSPFSLLNDAKNAVQTRGTYAPNTFDVFILAFKYYSGYQWAGLGTVGSTTGSTWLNGYFDFNVITHEIGHNVGLNHANRLISSTSAPFGGSTTRAPYGDPFDVMGNVGEGHFNPISKRILGYLSDPTNIRTVNVSGTYELFAHDSSANGDKLVGLRLRHNIAANTFVVVSFRSIAANNHMLNFGALEFHIFYPSLYSGDNATDLINANYIAGGIPNRMYPLRLGYTFCDPSSSPMYCVYFKSLNCDINPCSANVEIRFVSALPVADSSRNSVSWTYLDIPMSLTSSQFSTNTRWTLFFHSPYSDMMLLSNNNIVGTHNSPFLSFTSTSTYTGQYLFSGSTASGLTSFTVNTASTLVTGLSLTRTGNVFALNASPSGAIKSLHLLWNDMRLATASLAVVNATVRTGQNGIPGLHSVIGLSVDTSDVFRTSNVMFYYDEAVVPTFTLASKLVNNAWTIELSYNAVPSSNAIFLTTLFVSNWISRFNSAPVNAEVLSTTSLVMRTPSSASSNRILIYHRYTLTANTIVDFDYSASKECSSVTFGLRVSALSAADRGLFYHVAGTACATCKSIPNAGIAITGGLRSVRIPIGALDFTSRGTGTTFAFVALETAGASCSLQVNNIRWLETISSINAAASNQVSARDLSAVYNLQSRSTTVSVSSPGPYTVSLTVPNLNVTRSYTVYVTRVDGTRSIDASLDSTAVSPTRSVVINISPRNYFFSAFVIFCLIQVIMYF